MQRLAQDKGAALLAVQCWLREKIGTVPGACSSCLCCVGSCAPWHRPRWREQWSGSKNQHLCSESAKELHCQGQTPETLLFNILQKYKNPQQSRFDLLICINYLFVVMVSFTLELGALMASFFTPRLPVQLSHCWPWAIMVSALSHSLCTLGHFSRLSSVQILFMSAVTFTDIIIAQRQWLGGIQGCSSHWTCLLALC